MADLVEIRDTHLVHPQRVSAITLIKGTTGKPDRIDEDGKGWRTKNGKYDAARGEYEQIEEELAPPWWNVNILFTGGGSVVAGTEHSISWADREVDAAKQRARQLRDRTARQLGLGVRHG